MIFHILNGDNLQQRFPEGIDGELLVFSECLIEGPLSSQLSVMLTLRSAFLMASYQVSQEVYEMKTISEVNKVIALPHDAEVTLWFEEDLFCQVNLWFLVNLLVKNNISTNVFLVTPLSKSPYSFDRLTDAELVNAYTQKKRLGNDELNIFSSLWESYLKDDLKQLLSLAKGVTQTFPFIEKAVEAHIDRFPTESDPGKPQKLIIEIMEDLKTDNYHLIFSEFIKRAPVYGFGDIQIKRLLESI